MQPPGFSALALASRIRNLGKFPENGMQEPTQPDALALALHSNPVHAVIPVAGSYQWKAMATDSEASVQRAGAVFKERCAQF
jgi:hypothetical protein